MQTFEHVVANLPNPILREFNRALALGHWRNGIALTKKQRYACEVALGLRATAVSKFNPLPLSLEVKH